MLSRKRHSLPIRHRGRTNHLRLNDIWPWQYSHPTANSLLATYGSGLIVFDDSRFLIGAPCAYKSTPVIVRPLRLNLSKPHGPPTFWTFGPFGRRDCRIEYLGLRHDGSPRRLGHRCSYFELQPEFCSLRAKSAFVGICLLCVFAASGISCHCFCQPHRNLPISGQLRLENSSPL